MAGCELTLNHKALDRRGQIQKTHGVRYRRARTTDSSRNVLLGQAEVVDQLPVGRGLLKSIQILAVDVLNNRSFKRSLVIRIPHECRNAPEASALRGSPTTLSCDYFIAFYCIPYNNGLHNPYFSYRFCQ